MGQTTSLQNLEETPPSSSKHQVRHWSLLVPNDRQLPLAALLPNIHFSLLLAIFALIVYSGPPDPIHGTALYQKVRNTAQVKNKAYLITM